MDSGRRTRLTTALLLLGPVLFLNCRVWTPAPVSTPPAGASLAEEVVSEIRITAAPASIEVPASTEASAPVEAGTAPPAQPTAVFREAAAAQVRMGEPAGCLSLEAQSAFTDPREMLAYADQLLDLKHPLSERVLPTAQMAEIGLPSDGGAIVLDVDDVKNEYATQRMLNALLVSGFTAWLRAVPALERHILAVPLINPQEVGLDGGSSPWADYVRSYWQAPNSHPEQDPYLLPVLKLPPCQWMIARGFAPQIDSAWWSGYPQSMPNYPAAAEPYLAGSTEAAIGVARRIDWLFDGREGADTMCGPLAWEILDGAEVFPPGWGEWLSGPKAFWLSSPRKNGRPWSLFPRESYRLYQFDEPLGRFDFSQFPLFPGDFIYTYSFKDGFDHMLVVTEVDEAGNVYTVTNLIQLVPDEKITIERVLLLNLYDQQEGIARNRWAVDKKNGRTGHDGFEIFRWSWAEKDALGQPVETIVEPGDSLNLIAVRWRTPANWIAEYNGIALDAALQVGQKLVIPPNRAAE